MDLLFWCRRIFSSSSAASLRAARTKADQGDADAQCGLGLKFGAEPDNVSALIQAAEWFRKAADQDHSLAQFSLGMLLTTAQGLPRDDAAAISWFRRAAEGGDGGGQYMLGMRYYRSSVHRLQMDVVESRIEAYKWLGLAAAQGYKGSEAALERVTLGMSREEVIEGNERTASFVARSPVGGRETIQTHVPA